jgi:hypothetical protein
MLDFFEMRRVPFTLEITPDDQFLLIRPQGG